VALEITSAVDPSVVSQLKAAFDQEWSFPRLANNWMIAIQQTRGEPRASIRKVMAGMSPILELFERREETSIEVRSSPLHRPRAPGTTDELHEAMIRMFDLGVEVARLWSKTEPGHPGAIYPTISAGIGSNPQKLNQLVADCAERKVNKLVAAPADERHLFVWLDSSHEDAELAFATLPPPPSPTISPGIDIVWLVGPAGGPGGVRIWRLKPPGGWELCPPPTGYALRLG
jgi:hypothetical protein